VVGKLSGGNQQKVVLAKWLFTEPEPAHPRRAHPRHRRRGEVRDLRDHPALADEGKGVMVVSSELPELLGLSDRIYTLFEGRITGVLDKAPKPTRNPSCS
jgi:putative multiple sugar transport system ATP-binding protein